MDSKLVNEPVSAGERLIGLPEVASVVGVCARTVRREVDRGKFPKPVKVAGCVRWFRSEVLAYLERLRVERA